MRFSPAVCCVILILAAAMSSAAAGPVAPAAPAPSAAAPAFPDTAVGRAAREYFAAFNSGDETRMRRFFEAWFSPEALAERPAEPRLDVYRRMKGVNRTFRVERIVEASPDRIVLLVENAAHEWRRFDFVGDAKASGKIAGIGVEDADPPAGAEPPVRRETTDADAARAADAWLSEASARGDFSGVVLLARGGRPFFRKAWGLADRDRKIPNRADTKFNLGSINKIFTQVAIGQLAAAGKLSLSDTIRRHLPRYPAPYADRVTIGQLVSMSSGMGDIFGPKFAALPKSRLRSLADYLPLFQDDPLRFEPGSRKEYSNAGYVVLGLIVEAASGEDYYRYVREHVFAPAGMKDTDSWAIDDDVPNRAIGYTREAGGLRPNADSHPARGSSAGGGYSTVDDLLKFDAALRGGRLLPPEWTAWIFSRADAPSPGAPLPTHGALAIAGGSPGVNAALDMELDGGATVVVLANLDPPVAERTLKRIRGMLPKP
ncbi:MAG TPA: serine hydrolase domain-containing protein [Thermoanaerobaculia bacterium]|nr:serine hydrolase domain-containing protein [Thermoanaerobaculia bacterium]